MGWLIRISTLGITAVVIALSSVDSWSGDKGEPTAGYHVSVQIEQIDAQHWEATIALENTGPVAALTLPLSYGNGRSPFRVDSATYNGLRTEYFALKTFRVDSTRQSVLIGLISDLGGNYPPLEPGSGAIALLHLSSRKMAQVAPRLDTTFIAPHNILQLVSPDVRAIRPKFTPAHANHDLK